MLPTMNFNDSSNHDHCLYLRSVLSVVCYDIGWHVSRCSCILCRQSAVPQCTLLCPCDWWTNLIAAHGRVSYQNTSPELCQHGIINSSPSSCYICPPSKDRCWVIFKIIPNKLLSGIDCAKKYQFWSNLTPHHIFPYL